MIHFKKRYIVTIMVFVLLVAYIWQVCDVKRRFPAKKIEECYVSEWMDYNPRIEGVIDADVRMSPVDIIGLEGKDFIQKYPVTAKDYGDFDSWYILLVEFKMENIGENDVNIRRLVSFFEVVSPFNGYSNSLRLLIENGEITVGTGETKNIQAAIIVNRTYIGENNMKKFLESKFYLRIAEYPIEKRLVYE